MTSKPLSGAKIAVLVANGFSEQDVTITQRLLQEQGATTRMISMEDHGLSHSWNGEGWGLHFAADSALKSALAVDYDMLVVPGGQRSVEKLKLTAHTKRFVGGFISANKPLAVMGEALDLLLFAEQVAGKQVAGPQDLQDETQKHGANWNDGKMCVDGCLMTGLSDDDHRNSFATAIVDHFVSCYAEQTEMNKAA